MATEGTRICSAGLTPGGGEGWLMGKYGLTIDSLRSAEVVTAAGEIVTASPTEREDLFWAPRGGPQPAPRRRVQASVAASRRNS